MTRSASDSRLGHRRRQHQGGSARADPDGASFAASRLPFELQRDPAGLDSDTAPRWRGRLGGAAAIGHAVTMTAELSRAFRTKREGVGFVLDALEAAFPGGSLQCVHPTADFHHPRRGAERALVGRRVQLGGHRRAGRPNGPDCVLIDIGTTSTDIIPIVGRTGRRARATPIRSGC